MLLPLCGNGGNALSLPAQPPLSYPCNDKLPLNFQTCRWASDMKICLNATWSQAHFNLSTGSPKKCSDSRFAKSSSRFCQRNVDIWYVRSNSIFKVTIARIIKLCCIYGILDKEHCDNLLHKWVTFRESYFTNVPSSGLTIYLRQSSRCLAAGNQREYQRLLKTALSEGNQFLEHPGIRSCNSRQKTE